MRVWFINVGLPYHSPHKFRHGHIHYGLEHSQNIQDYKAVSMNVMHSSMKITDEFYSSLSDGEVKQRIDSINAGHPDNACNESIDSLLTEFLAWRENRQRTG